MSPVEYVEVVVRPTVLAFLKARDDRRLAYLSCIATYHVCDHIAYAKNLKTKETIIDELNKYCKNALGLVGGICNGTKHPKPRGVANPRNVKIAQQFQFDVAGAGFDENAWDGPALYLEDSGNTLFVHQCVQAVLLTAQTCFDDVLGQVDFSEFEDCMKEWHQSILSRLLPK